MELTPGSKAVVEVHDLAVGGEAVGRVDNFVVFVPNAAPGDQLEIEIDELKKNYARGHISRILRPSPERVQPRCPIYYDCGGCQLQHMSYEAQLRFKTKMVADSLQHVGGLDGIVVHPCIPMGDPWLYRNKVQAVVAAKPYLKESGTAPPRAQPAPPSRPGLATGAPAEEPPSQRFKPYIGLYAQGSHRVVKMEECLIQDPVNNEILQAAREGLERLGWPVYNEQDGSGLVRYLLVRTSLSTRQALLVLVASQPRLPHVQEFITFMRGRCKALVGVLLNLNPHRTNVILGSRNQLLWGKDHVIEEVSGLKFSISPASFFQVNTRGLEALYKILDGYCELRGKETVLDAYCGVGSIALYLARRARKVVGIDESGPAIEDAVVNSDLNQLGNVDFLAGTVEKVLPGLYQKGMRFHLAALDPPRKGCDPEVLHTLAKMRIPELIYISCNPSTLARDLALLAQEGYRTREVQPLDMFPQTYHVESVARLSRR
ncbi:MAG TPA: 23S rRNA (uracil(1939)-C(5))-methyltransferase RlmD [Candidatus Nitrosotenuis sp.]|nr:23S rRNA (uracil(1939)-C(5))-methyltransferase RlmD [Candidatus Nitrosotenuis sp.]